MLRIYIRDILIATDCTYLLLSFVSRTGKPELDNGSNFVGTTKEVEEIKVDNYQVQWKFSELGSRWIFNPHFGGVFESLIKSAKRTIHAILKNAEVSDEELETLIIRVDEMIISRALTGQRIDEREAVVLTPNHLLFPEIQEMNDGVITAAKGSGTGEIKLAKQLKNVTAYVGDKASFYCDISGKPMPHFSWKKALLPLIDINRKIKIRDKYWGSILKIEDLDFSDEGWYVCHAENVHGSVNTSAFLKVVKQNKSIKDIPNKITEDDSETIDDATGKGFCQTFQSSTCGNYLSGHMVYVTHGRLQSEKERRLASLVAEMSATLSQQADQECLKHIMQLTCHYNFLTCSEDKKPRRLCHEDCQDVTKKRCNYTYKLIFQKLKSNHLVSVPNCDSLNNDPTCFKFNEIPSKVVRTNPKPKESECFNGTGNEYVGTMSHTVQSTPCILWKDVTGFEYMSSENGNFCRNPKLENSQQPSGPWCFTSITGNWEICPLRRCSDITKYQNKSIQNLLPVYIAVSCVFGLVILLFVGCWMCKRAKYVTRDNCHSNVIGRKNYLGIYKQCQNDLKKTDNYILQINKMKINCNDYPLSQIRFQEQIGEGIFGAVYKAEMLPSKNIGQPDDSCCSLIIVKTLSAGSSSNLQRDFKREAQLMSELKHVNVLSIVGVSMRQIPWCLIFDYMERGDLHELLTACNTMERRSMSTVPADSMDIYGDVTLNYTDQIFVAAQIACGMEYLSTHNFVHRDLAARNILIGENLMCKICDIGLIKDVYSSDYYRSPGSSLMLPVRWMSPEAIAFGRFTVESDVWSYGILLWEIWSNGLQPFYGHSNTEVMDLIRSRQILPCPDNCPSRVYDLMLECWNEMARYRPQFKNIHTRIRVWQQEVVEINHMCVGGVSGDGSAKSTSQSGGSKHTTSSTEMCSDHSHLLNGYSPTTGQTSQPDHAHHNTLTFPHQFESNPLVISGQSVPVHFSRLPNTNTVYLPELSHIV